MLLTDWFNGLSIYITYMIFGDVAVPNIEASRHTDAPSTATSIPEITHPASFSPSTPVYTPTKCYACAHHDMIGAGASKFGVLRLEYCDTTECIWWADEVQNHTSANACGAFTAQIGCTLTCTYSTTSNSDSIAQILADLCPVPRDTTYSLAGGT